MKSFKDLTVWQKSMDLVNEVYAVVNSMPKMELYILASQMLRAAISIPSNIAEGYRRSHRAEFIHFLFIAIASAGELETQMLIAKKQYKDINYKKVEELLEEIQKMLYVLIQKMKQKTLNAER
ncbi:MAG: four helix bundle protein [Candidatus Doudnabacteria bacterium]|nr:four helix bundle protein [Candidatus Doudnabacteria bacterium]